MNQRFTKKAQSALDTALSLAREMGHTYVGSEHLLLGILSLHDSVGARILSDHAVEERAVRSALEREVGRGETTDIGASDMTPMTRRIIEESALFSARHAVGSIGTEHLLFAIASEEDSFGARLIKGQRASLKEIRGDITKMLSASFPLANEAKKESLHIPSCPALSRFGKDMCALAKNGRFDPIIGREEETGRLISILSRRTKNNPCLIGDPGVGKTAVVEGLCLKIASGAVPECLRDKRIISLDISAMVAGAKYRGEFEERMKSVLEEAGKDRDIILFVDEVHTVIGAGGAEGAMDAANILKPALARGDIRLIGATTVEEYRRHIEKDSALERRFQPINVPEPTKSEAILILSGLREKYEEHHRLKISDSAISAAVDLSDRYIRNRFLPDKAIDLIDEAASQKRIRALPEKGEGGEDLERKTLIAIEKEDFERACALQEKKRELCTYRKEEELILTREDIESTLFFQTGIPIKNEGDEERQGLLLLENRLCQKVIGQNRAARAVARAIRLAKTDLHDPDRPLASFIFTGETGVGKTYMAKTLAELLFFKKGGLLRFDMSEYMEKHSVSKLIGSPPGYIGYGEGGRLTEGVRREPYCVVLFDEIEKAHPDINNLLLQILDEGHLTDSNGKTVDFRNTVIIMTSNASSTAHSAKAGFTQERASEEDSERARKALSNIFSPEFLNRVDEIICFSPLGRDELIRIAELIVSDIEKRIKSGGIEINFEADVARLIGEKALCENMGARPLRRKAMREIEDSLSKAILRGEITKGDHITATVKDGAVVFEKLTLPLLVE